MSSKATFKPHHLNTFKRMKYPNQITKNKLLDAALHLFVERGFHASSVGLICKKAGVSKGAFFHYFVDKQAIAHAAIEQYTEWLNTTIEHAHLEKRFEHPVERVFGYVQLFEALCEIPPMNQGSMLGVLAQEVALVHEELRVASTKAFVSWLQGLLPLLREAFSTLDEMPLYWTPEALTELFVVLFEGGHLLHRMQRDEAVVKRQLQHFAHILQGILRV